MFSPQKLGRNDFCLCGSGRKYKHCCLVKAEIVESARFKLRRTEGELIHLLEAYARDRFGPGAMSKAWNEFFMDDECTLEEQQLHDAAFTPWCAFNWHPSSQYNLDKALLKKNLAEVFLAEEPGFLTEFQKNFIVAISQRPFSFYRITSVVPGKSLELKDMFTDNEYSVAEASASQILKKGDAIYARVLSMEGIAIMVGSSSLVIPPRYQFQILDFRDDFFSSSSPITEKRLRAVADEIRAFYLEHIDFIKNPPTPKLSNTDGDSISFIHVEYELKCTVEEAIDQLASLCVTHTRQEILDDVVCNDSTQIRSVSFEWQKRGNKKHQDWGNTNLGHIEIEGSKLVVSVNSENRAKKIREEIKKRLGHGIVFKRLEQESVESLMEKRKNQPSFPDVLAEKEHEDLMTSPEVQEQIRVMNEKHWQAWLDEKIPALKGETPRQAAQTAPGRARLEILFGGYEDGIVKKDDNIMSPDVEWLKSELGLNR